MTTDRGDVVAIVGCGNAKRGLEDGETVPIGELYTSGYFTKKREFAEALAERWYVLSAEHGVAKPALEVEEYEKTIDDLEGKALEEWQARVALTVKRVVGPYDRVVVLAGRDYVEHLETALDRYGIDVDLVDPFAETTGIGDQNGWMADALEAGDPFHPVGAELVTDGGEEVEPECSICGEAAVYEYDHEQGAVTLTRAYCHRHGYAFCGPEDRIRELETDGGEDLGQVHGEAAEELIEDALLADGSGPDDDRTYWRRELSAFLENNGLRFDAIEDYEREDCPDDLAIELEGEPERIERAELIHRLELAGFMIVSTTEEERVRVAVRDTRLEYPYSETPGLGDDDVRTDGGQELNGWFDGDDSEESDEEGVSEPLEEPEPETGSEAHDEPDGEDGGESGDVVDGDVLEEVEVGQDVAVEIDHPNGRGTWELIGEVTDVDETDPLTVDVEAEGHGTGLELSDPRVELFAWRNPDDELQDVSASFMIVVEDDTPNRTGIVRGLDLDPDAVATDDVDDLEDEPDAELFQINEECCRALVSGGQCGNGLKSPKAEDALCGTHANARIVKRVDELDGKPYVDLLDELSEIGFHDEAAWQLASITPDPAELFRIATGLEDAELNDGTEIGGRTLASRASGIACLEGVDARGHPLAFANCAAIIASGSYGTNYQCKTKHHGTKLLCGQHGETEPDVSETVFGEHGPETPDFPRLEIDGAEYLGIEPRDDDLIAVSLPDYDVVRLEGEGSRMSGYARLEGEDVTEENNSTLSEGGAGELQDDDVDDRPAILSGLEPGDEVVATASSVNGRERYAGRVTEIGDIGFSGGEDGATVMLDNPAGARNLVLLRAHRDGDEWGDLEVVEYNPMFRGETGLGYLADVDVLEDDETAVLTGAGAQTIRGAIENGDAFPEGAPVTVNVKNGSAYVGHVRERQDGAEGPRIVVEDREEAGTLVLEAGEKWEDVALVEGDRDGDGVEEIGPVEEIRVGNTGGESVTTRGGKPEAMPTRDDGAVDDSAAADSVGLPEDAVTDDDRETVIGEIAEIMASTGLIGSQVLDYYAVERLGYSQTKWAEECGRSQQSVSRAVNNAKDALDDADEVEE